jgi:hypothetical protein
MRAASISRIAPFRNICRGNNAFFCHARLSRSKNGMLSHAYVPGIHVLTLCTAKNVDARDKRGHDA